MSLVGIHYKVTWHFKGTSEVASANLNFYDNYNDQTFMEDSMKRLVDEVERFYPSSKYNSKTEIKAMNVNHVPVPIKNLVPLRVGEQKEINDYISDLQNY